MWLLSERGTLGRMPSHVVRDPIADMDALALVAGLVYIEVPALIEIGVVKGFIEDSEDGEVALTAKGWRWWERDRERRE
jgi:hypothetical protein